MDKTSIAKYYKKSSLMVEIMVKTMEECLQILGCKKPFKKYNLSKNPFYDMFTDKGYKAYNKLREILFFMVDMDIIPEFNEDKLDKFIDINE